jgi:hypothetical protein
MRSSQFRDGSAQQGQELTPELLEPIRYQLSIANRVLHVLVPSQACRARVS